MKSTIVSGFLAAAAAVSLPLLICGMGSRTPDSVSVSTPAPSIAVQESPQPTSPTSAPRTVQEIIVHHSAESSAEPQEAQDIGDYTQTVSVTVDGTPKDMTLHDYLTGVLMGEMPASYELEALKAQAVAARTYTLHRLAGGGTLSDDPSVCQAFIPMDRAQDKLGTDWETLLGKLHQAVDETDGQVLTYNGQLISATYFSGSGGKTESAQAVWGSDIPYLVSVESPGEETTSDYESTVTVPLSEFLNTLEITVPTVSSVSYTTGDGVDTIVIGGKTFTGLQLRSAFQLRSTRFQMTITEDAVTFDVLGNGHRVGMSQCGAEAMAESGSAYQDILLWYYTGVTLTQWQG